MYLYSLAVDEVSQSHLLVAGEFVPCRSRADGFEVDGSVEEVSNKLTADVLIHDELKFEV